MKKTVVIGVLAAILFTAPAYAVERVAAEAISINATAALLMEKTGGEVIYAKDEHKQLSPASVTKIMTLLLTLEEIEAGRLSMEDMVSCSQTAASMGGSQIWLEEGEQMSVHDLLKAVTVVSANDCAVALAEHIAGSEESFVVKMNQRAQELGMEDTVFYDCTGLTDNPEHLTSAYDVALMSRELIGKDAIKEFTTIWMDTLRNGESALVNTNKLVRFYPGTTGLKTGFTGKAMYCLSATAERDGAEYIAVIMHAPTTKDRFEGAKTLLNYAFANYTLLSLRSPDALPPVKVELGEYTAVDVQYTGKAGMLFEKAKACGNVSYKISLPESLTAPVTKGDIIGELLVTGGDRELARIELTAASSVKRLTVKDIYMRMLSRLMGG